MNDLWVWALGAVMIGLCLAYCDNASGQSQVRVIDGDTIVVGAVRYRLVGMDAPELHQSCADGFRAGLEAKALMEKLVVSSPIICTDTGAKSYNRHLGYCSAGGQDLGEIMVAQGLAWAEPMFSMRYVGTEKRAASNGVGVHGHQGCAKPWEWRKREGY